MIPPHYATDREMLGVALSTIGLTEPAAARMLWIRNTLQLSELECSEAFLSDALKRDDLEILTEPRALPLDADGMLPPRIEESLRLQGS
jgi:hypothetical protein